MNTIEKAIQEFKEKRLAVYRADSEQIVRDTRAAERATKDHAGRWLFELLQNSDDAKATEVRVIINDGVVYVADDGLGLKPDAVSAICGTDLSDKHAGMIGRKGVGFKSVYEVSSNPQVLTVNGDGIEFSRDKTQSWFNQNGFDDGYIPYQWIPFFVSWEVKSYFSCKIPWRITPGPVVKQPPARQQPSVLFRQQQLSASAQPMPTINPALS